MDQDPFGKSYKLVMWKLRGPPAITTMEQQTLEAVIGTLFPSYQRRAVEPMAPAESIVAITPAVVDAAIIKAKAKNKAPSVGGITSHILTAVHKADPSKLTGLCNNGIGCGTVPSE